jgi:osmotically-inducible protein OsmY
MAVTRVEPRPDVDIYEDIDQIIVRYPPMVNDRHHIKASVENGAVKLAGHVRTGITLRYLLDSVAQIPGVATVDSSQLYNDETVRREVGQLVPPGVFVNVEIGVVILSGRLPPGTDAATLIEQVRAAPGVRQVIAKFI